jgi:hypothetical protein
MGKIGRIARTAVRKDYLLSFTGTFVAVLAVPAAFVSMLGGHLSVRMTSFLTLVAVSTSAVVNRHKWSTKLPVKVIMPGKKTLRCPSDLNLTRQSVKLARYEFGRNTISLTNYEPLRAKNSYILVCLTGGDGEFLGYFDVFPLKATFAELFLQGRVGEKDLTHEDILDAHEMRRCKYVYIAGLAVCDSERQACQVNAAILIWGLLKYLDHFYGASKPYVIASAATGDGENLLQSFNIPLVCSSDSRADGQTMYGLYLSRSIIAERIACVPDYSLLCSLDWTQAKSSGGDSFPVPRRPILPQKKRRSLSAKYSGGCG